LHRRPHKIVIVTHEKSASRQKIPGRPYLKPGLGILVGRIEIDDMRPVDPICTGELGEIL
jgi:hypothetical protein